MSGLDSFFFPHKVQVQARRPGGGMGGGFAPPVTVAAEVIDRQTMVRDANGAEVVSSTRVTVPAAAVVPLGSLVTVWAGKPHERTAKVLTVSHEENDPPLPSHVILWLE